MYRAKDRGRNTYQFFTPALKSALRFRRVQERALEQAIARDDFVVLLPAPARSAQRPVARSKRWSAGNHPRPGLVFPALFIPNAELSG